MPIVLNLVDVLDVGQAFAILRNGDRVGTMIYRNAGWEIRDRQFQQIGFERDIEQAIVRISNHWRDSNIRVA